MPTASTPGQRISVRAFLAAYTVTATVLVIFTGLFLFFAARGTDVAMADWRFLRMTKWYLVDIHVVLGFAVIAAGGLYGLTRLRRRAERFRVRLLWSVLGCAAALYTGWYVIGAHPVLIQDVRVTAHPAGTRPDQITLTWNGDPTTTQAVQWRTSVTEGANRLRYRPASGGEWHTVPAETSLLEDPQLANDPVNAHHTAALNDLTPGTAYVYQVGHGDDWSPEARFTTASPDTDTFSFIYMGDVQIGIEGWSAMMQAAYTRHPEAAFYILARDLVNKGCRRNEWDTLFHSAGTVFAKRPLVPLIGNHDDCEDGEARMYLQLFDLPDNGPKDITPERAYSYTYGNAFFVVLDSNLDPDTQTDWLDQQLAQSNATWKFVMLHHPPYTSKPHRDNSAIRDAWCPLFDKYHVDMVLVGHDHAYTRTYPLMDGKIVDDPNQGVNYILSVAGSKYYPQEERDFIEVAYTKLSTYQVIDIRDKQLSYRAYDLDGKVIDQLDLAK